MVGSVCEESETELCKARFFRSSATSLFTRVSRRELVIDIIPERLLCEEGRAFKCFPMGKS